MEKKGFSNFHCWTLLLQELNYITEHRSGAKMPPVDALSRFLVDVMCTSTDNILFKIKLAQDNDSEVKAILDMGHSISNQHIYFPHHLRF